MAKLTLTGLYNTDFPKYYYKLLKQEEFSNTELQKILELVIAFTNFENLDIRNLGYRLLLLYSKKTKDYKPLYEISINKGLIPIAHHIYNVLGYRVKYGNISTEINDILSEDHKIRGIYRTEAQKKLIEDVQINMDHSQLIVAPTSYGKTELIVEIVSRNRSKNICILTPTKSLLAQTKSRIIKDNGVQKIITQPEMYVEGEEGILAVLTQERLLRLLQLHENLTFDILVVDEAHNLLDNYDAKNQRSVLLASVIILCFSRNSDLVCKFLTPFLKSLNNIKIKYTEFNIVEHMVSEFVKSEMFYFYDIGMKTKKLYDQYSPRSDKFIEIDDKYNKAMSDSSVVQENMDKKNIVYLNKPRDAENFSEKIYKRFDISKDNRVQNAIKSIQEFIHKDYKLIKFLEHGVIYHHGSVPESIRFYLEDLYSSVADIKIVVTTSTLLEGVNIPATKMFILDPSKGRGYLSPSSFKNLIGRVCRFGEIFDPKKGNLNFLLPEIHIVKGEYCRSNFNASSFASSRKLPVTAEIEDENRNPLMENGVNNDSTEQAEEFLQNLTNDLIIDDFKGRVAKTDVGKLCYRNNISIFEILKHEASITSEIEKIGFKMNSLDDVFKLLHFLFFKRIEEDIAREDLKRLRNEKA